MDVVHSYKELQGALKTLPPKNLTGFVPTMGALHAGHLSLIDTARTQADTIIASLFVNPTQFAANEDLATYPKNEQHDLELLKKKQVDLVYCPSPQDIYPNGPKTTEDMGNITQILEGIARPHFFNGVATVVKTLFQQVQPNVAVFGEKDYQQLKIIQQLVTKHQFPITVLPSPTIREDDGLACASRNIYLSSNQRNIAPTLYQTLTHIKQQITQKVSPQEALQHGKEQLLAAGFNKVDYLSYCDHTTLQPLTTYRPNTGRLLAAAYLGTTRLIDNIAI